MKLIILIVRHVWLTHTCSDMHWWLQSCLRILAVAELASVGQVAMSVDAPCTTKAASKFLGSTCRCGRASLFSGMARGRTIRAYSNVHAELAFFHIAQAVLSPWVVRMAWANARLHHKVSLWIELLRRDYATSASVLADPDSLLWADSVGHRQERVSLRVKMEATRLMRRPLHHAWLVATDLATISVCLCAFKLLKRSHFWCPHDLLDVILVLTIRISFQSHRILLIEHIDKIVFILCRYTIIFDQVMHFVNCSFLFIKAESTLTAFSDLYSRFIKRVTCFVEIRTRERLDIYAV